MSTTTKKAAQTKTVSQIAGTTYEQIQRSLKDTAKVEEKQLQQSVKSNLKSLKTKIERTNEDLNDAIAGRDSALESANVNWDNLIAADAEIEALQMGLDKLKSFRNQYFPNWQSTLVAD